MDQLLALKPILTALVLPAASGGLLMLTLLAWAWRRSPPKLRQGPRGPLLLAAMTAALLWLFSCPAVALWLSQSLLPQVPPVTPAELRQQKVQAIVVLGGGVENEAREYQGPTLGPDAMARLLYGVHLARITQLPMAYSGGKGWGGINDQVSEAQVADLALARLGLAPLRWQENQSRDTRENALLTAALLRAEGVSRVALVTHAWHIPRSVRQFEAASLVVVPAPMGYLHSDAPPILQWIPSGSGLRETGWVLKEWLGLKLLHY